MGEPFIRGALCLHWLTKADREGSMAKSVFRFIATAAVILLLSGALAPWIYSLLPYKFERVFNRLVMVLSLAAVLFFVRLRKNWTEDYGCHWIRGQSLQELLTGYSIGISVLLVFLGLKVILKHALWAPEAAGGFGVIGVLMAALFSALLIGCIEEFFFRGFVYKTLSSAWGWPVSVSVGVTSVFYSLIHFVSFYKPLVDKTPTWLDSLRLIAAPIVSLGSLHQYWPEAVGLFLFGLVLSRAVLTAGSLFPAIGLHAGCVFFVKMDGSFFKFSEGIQRLYVSSGKFYDGVLGWFFLGLMSVLLQLLLRENRQKLNPMIPRGENAVFKP